MDQPQQAAGLGEMGGAGPWVMLGQHLGMPHMEHWGYTRDRSMIGQYLKQ
jgi:hypothetical protein